MAKTFQRRVEPVGEGDGLGLAYVQHSLCKYCSEFVRHTLTEWTEHDRMRNENMTSNAASDATSDTVSEQEPMYGNPRMRTSMAVSDSAELGCWICNHIISGLRRDRHGKVHFALGEICLYALASNEVHIVSNFLQRHGGRHVDEFKIIRLKDSRTERQMLLPSKDMDSSTWSKESSSKARAWLRECDEAHEQCRRERRAFASDSLPLRLLEVGNVYEGSLKLVDGSSLLPSTTYATLSHCWGDVRQGVLLKSQLAAYRRRISIASLPRSIREAAEICADLELRYLWIDSLCIAQDDRSEWMAEAPRMTEIYSNSYLTLAATASRSDDEGLKRPLSTYLIAALIFRAVDSCGETHEFTMQKAKNYQTQVDRAPLNQRAWVLQERALSRRILHFADDQIHWECPLHVLTQFDFTRDDRRRLDASPWRSMMQWKAVSRTSWATASNATPHKQAEDYPLLDKWDDLVMQYSSCRLTYDTDKLMAISGLAKRIEGLTSWPDTDYLAGLWRPSLPRRLLWRTFRRSPGIANDVPSWSWACINGQIDYPRLSWTDDKHGLTGHNVVDVLSATTTLVQDPFGGVKDGAILLRGHLCLVRTRQSFFGDSTDSSQSTASAKVRVQGKWLKLQHSPIPHFAAWFDLPRRRQELLGRTIFFLPILDSTFIERDSGSEPGSRQPKYCGLMLQPTRIKRGQFRRVGNLEITRAGHGLAREAFFGGGIDNEFYQGYDGVDKFVVEIV